MAEGAETKENVILGDTSRFLSLDPEKEDRILSRSLNGRNVKFGFCGKFSDSEETNLEQ